MIARMKFVGLGVLAVFLLGAMTAVSAQATPKPKPELVLKKFDEGKKEGEVVKTGKVPAGVFVGFPEGSYEGDFCQILGGEPEEEMTLVNNSSTKADKATGTVEAPPCYEIEGEGESEKAVVSKTASLAGGSVKSQEMTVKHTGKVGLTSALLVTLKNDGAEGRTCVYESKTSIKATWPPEENPNLEFITDTANLVAALKLKLDKTGSAKTGCPKSQEVFYEVWLGPLGEEFEAELT